ncbi:hypothetical protein Pint_21258 [Pistacia integerrima]|uniref:Uncharacterized protein n=1 Tax=Pistacia integerrima TaxID=434235 RepID=A0ACC0X980_9ROSI|nr:hypothetical protein Pint_21258 [Pistacia integerrima]
MTKSSFKIEHDFRGLNAVYGVVLRVVAGGVGEEANPATAEVAAFRLTNGKPDMYMLSREIGSRAGRYLMWKD